MPRGARRRRARGSTPSARGYTAWERYDHNRIDLVPEKKTCKPGETARIMIKSPWEHATALLTTEREGVRTWKHVRADVDAADGHRSDHRERHPEPLRLGAAAERAHERRTPKDEQRSRQAGLPPRLHRAERRRRDEAAARSTVKANRDEYRPASKARIEVDVKDVDGQAVAVRGHAVGGRLRRAVADRISDARRAATRSISRKRCRSSTKTRARRSSAAACSRRKAQTRAAAADAMPGRAMIRKDFRVLAFWLGSVVTDGRATRTPTSRCRSR